MDQLDGSPADTDDRAGYLWIPWDSRAGVLSLACGAPMPCGAGSSHGRMFLTIFARVKKIYVFFSLKDAFFCRFCRNEKTLPGA